ncbi:MAG: orotate phosphoribosyltransferase [Phycisphaeraceae bacterium]
MITTEAPRVKHKGTNMTSCVHARHSELLRFIDQRVLKRGKFRLASGRESSYYLDGKLASMDPVGISLICDAIFDEIAHLGNVDAIGGMDMGATPIVGALALRSGQIGRPLPTFVVRKAAKEHGTRKLIEGPLQSGMSVVIVDDVVTTGSSILQAIDAVEQQKCKVLLAISVVDRDVGAGNLLTQRGISYQPLVTVAELGLTQ